VENHKINVRYTIIVVTILLVVMFPHVTVHADTENSPTSNGIPFYIVATIIGGVIVITLTYVSWKKYRAERKNTKENDNS